LVRPMARKAKTASVKLLGIPAFPVPIFGGKLVLCTSPQEWDALAAAFGDATGTDGCKGLAMRYYSDEHGRVYAAGVFDKAVDTLVHELAHATFFLLGDVGIPVASGEDNESFTYILGWLMRETFPVFQAAVK
jgi:hypothetical protein